MPPAARGVGGLAYRAAVAERIQDWWARRQFSRGRAVPYEVGAYRDAWAPYPALVRQYHPDLNAGIVLSQIPPAADVLLLWQCETGHLFVATPVEQRSRPGRVRRRSAWCPDCTAAARPARSPVPIDRGAADATTEAAPDASPAGLRTPRPSPDGVTAPPRASRARASRPARPPCAKTPAVPAGTPFLSACAPAPASAAEQELRRSIFAALTVTEGMTAVRVRRPFFDHLEVWPDILLPELRVAIEYDTIGRFGLEHVGTREETDRRKDRLLRAAGWEVVRLRTGKLPAIGPHDITAATISRRGILRLIDVLSDIRGPLLIEAYRA